MVGSLSSSVTLYFFNAAFMYWLGVDGVAALTIASYSTYVFNSIFYGFCEATAPILGYKYGEQNWTELACVFRNSMIIMTVFSLAAYGLSVLFAAPVLGFFAPQDSHVFELVLANFGYFALSLLLLCPNMFAAYLFTAMGDGKRAAIVSFCRTFLFTVLAIECLPLAVGEIGLWFAVPLAELLTLILSATLVTATADNPRRLSISPDEATKKLTIRLWKPFRKKYSAIRFCKSLHRRQKCLLKSVLFLFLCLEI